jgi:DNA mismatch repair protein MutL
VQNLFFNVPARRKFLKSTQTEFRHIYDVLQRIAISHPETALHFSSENREVFRLQPGSPHQRLLDLLGERRCEQLLPVEEGSDPLKVWGFIGKPTFGQKSRSNQFLFLNGRYILNRPINYAIASAYEHLMSSGGYPFFVIFLEVDPRHVDVNVHPAKLEAKFEDEQAIYRAVHSAVRNCLAGAGSFPALSLRGSQQPDGSVDLRFTPRQHAGGTSTTVDPHTGEIFQKTAAHGSILAGDLLGEGNRRTGTDASGPIGPSAERVEAERTGQTFWQIHDRYILCQTESGLLVVDQHVAHERVLYEQGLVRMNKGRIDSQQLMFPVTLQLNPAEHSLVEELLPGLRQLGFDIAMFGKNTIVVNGIPADVKSSDVENLVSEIVALYAEYQNDSPLEVRDNLLKSFACRAAVKAGDKLTNDEMKELLHQLMEAKMPYVCPHGRPIVLRIPVDELDRRFGRK